MLLDDDLPRLRCEFGADFTTPCAVFEGLARPRCLLDGRNILPALVIARAVAMMQGIENAEFRSPYRVQDLQHVRDTAVGLSDRLQAIPEFAALGDEIVYGSMTRSAVATLSNFRVVMLCSPAFLKVRDPLTAIGSLSPIGQAAFATPAERLFLMA